ncbi:MAG: DUF423 domain-containing protein [Magnetococcales bacterium]|nr:DUF423 domain-containing protein [Magnetococcales bacterium]
MNAKGLLFWGAVAAGLAVILGAYGAHDLHDQIDPERLITFRKGVTYQMHHALGLMLIGGLLFRFPDAKGLLWAGRLLLMGILLFSGGLYLLVFTGVKAFAWLTPIGGFCFIFGWGTLAWTAKKELD